MERRDVVITGVGAVTPHGCGAASLWDGWIAGRVAIEDGRAHCRDFRATDWLTKKDIRRSDRFTHLSVAAAEEAMLDAGWGDGVPGDPDLAGVVWGTQIGGIVTIEETVRDLVERGAECVSPYAIPAIISNSAPAAIAMRRGLRGPSFAVSVACASGGQSLAMAWMLLQTGAADVVVAGGSEAPMTPMADACFASVGATSLTGRSLPFDVRRDGFVPGEGAGAVVLEAAEVARARGARVHGTLLGVGLTSDAHHIVAPGPDGRQAARAMTLALRSAGVDPDDVAYVNAHGTGTPLNDAAEVRAIRTALGPRAETVPVSSLKSSTGHLIGAAGVVEAIVTLRALNERVTPPTLSCEQPDPALGLDFVRSGPRPMETRSAPPVALSNSFGFGGHNAVLCLGAAA